MKYYAFYYLARKIITDFKIELLPDDALLKSFLAKFLDQMDKVKAGNSVAPGRCDYAKTASLLLMIKKLPVYFEQEIPESQQAKLPLIMQNHTPKLQELLNQLEPMRKIALTERHVADFYLGVVATYNKAQKVSLKDEMAFEVVKYDFLKQGHAEYLDKISTGLEGSKSLKADLEALNPITFDSVLKVLHAKVGELVGQFDDANQQELAQLIQFCDNIIAYCIPTLINQTKALIIATCEPEAALVDEDKKALFADLDQRQLQNAIYYYQILLKNFGYKGVDLTKIKQALYDIEFNISADNFVAAATQIIDFYRGADMKYADVYNNAYASKRYSKCQIQLFDIVGLKTPMLRDAIAPGVTMFFLRSAITNADGKKPSLLNLILTNLPESDQKTQLIAAANKLHGVFTVNPYAAITDVDANDLGEFSALIDALCSYDAGMFTFLSSSHKKVADAAKEIQLLLLKMRNLSLEANAKFAGYYATHFHNRLFVDLINELELPDGDQFKELLSNLQMAGTPDNLDNAFSRDLKTINSTKYHNPLPDVDRMRLCIRRMLVALDTYVRAEDEKRAGIVKTHLQAVLLHCHPADRVLSIATLMRVQLMEFRAKQEHNPNALHKSRVDHIMARLLKIALRVGEGIPPEEQIYYQDKTIYSHDAILEDILQQLNKEIILLQHSTLRQDTSQWLNWASTMYNGDDGKALQAELEGMLQDFKPYFPEHCRSVIDSMQTMREKLAVSTSMRDKSKCNAAQQKREPDNDALKKVVTF